MVKYYDFSFKQTYMTQEQVNSLIRTILSLLGAFLAGGGLKLFGMVIDTAYWMEITGVVLAIVSIVWSVVSKTVNIEKLEGAIRQTVTFVCGIFLAKGLLTEQTVAAILAFIGAILPLLQSYLAKKKSEDIENGVIPIARLKKAA